MLGEHAVFFGAHDHILVVENELEFLGNNGQLRFESCEILGMKVGRGEGDPSQKPFFGVVEREDGAEPTLAKIVRRAGLVLGFQIYDLAGIFFDPPDGFIRGVVHRKLRVPRVIRVGGFVDKINFNARGAVFRHEPRDELRVDFLEIVGAIEELIQVEETFFNRVARRKNDFWNPLLDPRIEERIEEHGEHDGRDNGDSWINRLRDPVRQKQIEQKIDYGQRQNQGCNDRSAAD